MVVWFSYAKEESSDTIVCEAGSRKTRQVNVHVHVLSLLVMEQRN